MHKIGLVAASAMATTMARAFPNTYIEPSRRPAAIAMVNNCEAKGCISCLVALAIGAAKAKEVRSRVVGCGQPRLTVRAKAEHGATHATLHLRWRAVLYRHARWHWQRLESRSPETEIPQTRPLEACVGASMHNGHVSAWQERLYSLILKNAGYAGG